MSESLIPIDLAMDIDQYNRLQSAAFRMAGRAATQFRSNREAGKENQGSQ